jgi:hypothetical protein
MREQAMSIRRALSAVTMLTLLAGWETARADDYVVEIGGTEGTPFGGTCLLIRGDGYERRPAIGAVPLSLAFSADVISCAIQRKAGSGDLRIVITGSGGRLVAQSSTSGPFGVVMAAGR